jgi:hypothetical protein
VEQSLNDFSVELAAPRPHLPQPAAVDEPPPRGRGLWGRLSIAEWLLKHRDYLLAQIDGGREVPVIVADLLIVALVPTAFYGLVTGLATNSLVRVLSNPVKLPVMLILTMFLCLPTLYIFSSYMGSRRTFLQTAALAFTSLAIIGVVLAAFAPITWFLTFTAPGAYALHVLVNVAVFVLGGFMGVAFLLHGCRTVNGEIEASGKQTVFLWSWMVLYGLVGAQMGWIMRPFFSSTDVWIRPRDPNEMSVFQALANVVQQVFGG